MKKTIKQIQAMVLAIAMIFTVFYSSPISVMAAATMTVANLFSNDMIMQRNETTNVFGTGEPGATVTVTFNGQTKTGTVQSDGKWTVKLDPMSANVNEQTMVVSDGVTTKNITGVLIGDVYFACGQSNLEDALTSNDPDWASNNYANIRFNARQNPSTWVKASNLKNVGAVYGTRASYYYAVELYNKLGGNVPIAIVARAISSSNIKAWYDPQTVLDNPDYLDSSLLTDIGNGVMSGVNFESQIRPTLGFKFKGMLWWQGEANAGGASNKHAKALKDLIKNWRVAFGFDFYFFAVELESYNNIPFQPPQTKVVGQTGWFDIRTAIGQILSIKKTAVITGWDICDGNIHPATKQYYGRRLALAAFNMIYGYDNEYMGPVLTKTEISGNTITMTFDHAEGMHFKDITGSTMDGIRGLAIGTAGATNLMSNFWATATGTISGNKLIVTGIDNPAKAFYIVDTNMFYQNNPFLGNLVNGVDLPAAAFRSDADSYYGYNGQSMVYDNVAEGYAVKPNYNTAIPENVKFGVVLPKTAVELGWPTPTALPTITPYATPFPTEDTTGLGPDEFSLGDMQTQGQNGWQPAIDITNANIWANQTSTAGNPPYNYLSKNWTLNIMGGVGTDSWASTQLRANVNYRLTAYVLYNTENSWTSTPYTFDVFNYGDLNITAGSPNTIKVSDDKSAIGTSQLSTKSTNWQKISLDFITDNSGKIAFRYNVGRNTWADQIDDIKIREILPVATPTLVPTPSPTPRPTLSYTFAPYVSDKSANYNFKQVRIGGGGFVMNILIHPTVPDLVYCHTDVGGAYKWNAATKTWTQLITASRMPASLINASDGSMGPGMLRTRMYSVESVAIDAQNPNVVFIASGSGSDGVIVKSTDGGQSFTQMNMTGVTMRGNGDNRTTGQRLVVDPNNSNIVYFGSRDQGLWKSTDGGMNWAQFDTSVIPADTADDTGKTDLPNGTDFGVGIVLFDPSSGVDANGDTKRIYVSAGGAGTLVSEDAGQTWAVISTAVAMDMQVSNGIMYAGLYGLGISKYIPGSGLTNVKCMNTGICNMAVDPKNSNIVYAIPSGGQQMYRTLNGGTTWTQLSVNANSYKAPDKLWKENTDMRTWLSCGQYVIDPHDSSKMWFAEGMGVWQSTNISDTNSAPTFRDVSDGIEELVGTDVMAAPNNKYAFSGWDRIGFTYAGSLDKAPDYQLGISQNFTSGMSLAACASNPNFLVINAADERGTWMNNTFSGYSEDGGTTWTPFGSITLNPSDKNQAATNNPVNLKFGEIAVSANDTSNMVWVPRMGTDVAYYSKDKGATWTQSAGLDTFDNSNANYLSAKRVLVADKVAPNTFYLYSWTGTPLLKSTDGGATFVVTGTGIPTWVWHPKLKAVPGKEGNLFFATGFDARLGTKNGLYTSTNGGVSFSKIANVQDCWAVGFGKAKAVDGYPAIYIYGKVDNKWGLYRSNDQAATWDFCVDYPLGLFDVVNALDGDMDVYGKVLVAFNGNGFAYGYDVNEWTPPTPEPTSSPSPTPIPTPTPTPTAVPTPTPTITGVNPNNLFGNAGFETTGSWTNINTSTIVYSTERAASGNRCIKISNGATASWVSLTQSGISLEANKTYMIEFKHYGDALTYLQVKNGSTDLLGVTSGMTSSDGWTTCRRTFNTSTAVSSASVYFVNNTANSVVYIDDVVLRELPSSLDVDYSIGSNNLMGANANFEVSNLTSTLTNGWMVPSNITRSSDEKFDGYYSLKVTGNTAWQDGYYTIPTLEPYSNYELSFMHKGPYVNYLYYVNGNNTSVSLGALSATNDWSKYVITFNTGDGSATRIWTKLRIQNNTNVGSKYMDCFSLKKIENTGVSATARPSPTSTPIPTASPSPAPTPTPTVSPTPAPTSTPTASPTPPPTATPTATPTASPSPTQAATPTASPSLTPTVAPSQMPTVVNTLQANLNLITNPGFEDGSSGWTLSNAASIDSTDKYSGVNSLKISSSNWAVALSRTFEVEANTEYMISFLHKGSTVPQFSFGTSNTPSVNASTFWRPDAYVYKTGESETTLTVRFVANTGVTYYLDDFTLSKVETKLSADYSIDSSANLIGSNANFETGKPAAFFDYASKTSLTNDSPFEGSQCLLITSPGSYSMFGFSTTVSADANPNTIYELSFYYKGASNISLRYKIGSGTEYSIPNLIYATTTWAKRTYYINTAAETGTLKLNFYLNDSGTNYDYIDAMMLRKVALGTATEATVEPTVIATPTVSPSPTPTATPTASPSPTPTLSISADITGLTVRRATCEVGTTTNYVLMLNKGEVSTAFAPIFVSAAAKYELVSGNATLTLGGSGLGFFMVVSATTVATKDEKITFKVTDTNGASTVEKIYTVLVKRYIEKSANILGYTVRNGSVSGNQIVFDSATTRVALRPNLMTTTATYSATINGITRALVSGGDGYSYVQIFPSDIATNNVELVITVTDDKIVKTYTLYAEKFDASLKSIIVKRGIYVTNQPDANYTLQFDQVTSTSVAICAVPTKTSAKFLSATINGTTAGLVSGGDGYMYVRVFRTDITAGDAVVMMTIQDGPIKQTYKVIVEKPKCTYKSILMKRGTYEATGNTINAQILSTATSVGISLVPTDIKAKFLVDGVALTNGGDGCYYLVVNKTNIIAAGGKLTFKGYISNCGEFAEYTINVS